MVGKYLEILEIVGLIIFQTRWNNQALRKIQLSLVIGTDIHFGRYGIIQNDLFRDRMKTAISKNSLMGNSVAADLINYSESFILIILSLREVGCSTLIDRRVIYIPTIWFIQRFTLTCMPETFCHFHTHQNKNLIHLISFIMKNKTTLTQRQIRHKNLTGLFRFR